MLNICPSSNHRAKNHESEREECRGRNASSEPQDFSVCNDNDGQVLENRVNRDGKELERFRAGIDHTNEKKGDWEPYSSISPTPFKFTNQLTSPRLLRIEWRQIRDQARLFAEHNSNNTHKRLPMSAIFLFSFTRNTYLNRQVKEVQIPVLARNTIFIGNRHRYRGQTIRQDRNRGTIRDIRQAQVVVGAGSRSLRAAEEGLSLRGRGPPVEVAHLD
jgi:hypothetical protein